MLRACEIGDVFDSLSQIIGCVPFHGRKQPFHSSNLLLWAVVVNLGLSWIFPGRFWFDRLVLISRLKPKLTSRARISEFFRALLEKPFVFVLLLNFAFLS